MRESLEKLCRSFADNTKLIKSTCKMENAYVYPICSAIISKNNVSVSADVLNRCRNILKENTSVFSIFRGNIRLVLISLMAVADDPKVRLEKAMAAYNAFKKHFSASDHLGAAAILVSDMAEEYRYDEIAARAKRIYKEMKSQHPMITSAEDVSYAAMLAFLPNSEQSIVEETERCYQRIKEDFKIANSAQSVSHVLAVFEGDSNQKCTAVKNTYDALKARGYKFGKYSELSMLAVLSMLEKENEHIMDDLIEADKYLSSCKGYGGLFGFSKKDRLTHAAMLVSYDLSPGCEAIDFASFTGAVALMVAQQVAMCSAIVAVQASSAAAT